jgi:hypothetical protein
MTDNASIWAQEWIAEKRAAKHMVRDEEIVTSFTDSQPLHGWRIEDAVRELWQNYKDGVQTRFKCKIDLRTVYNESNMLIRVSSHLPSGEEVGSLDLSHPRQLILRQKYCMLNPGHLQLASGKRTSDGSIGGHGEGFKVGLNLLLRNNFEVDYKMPFCTWKFSLRNKYSRNFRNMC